MAGWGFHTGGALGRAALAAALSLTVGCGIENQLIPIEEAEPADFVFELEEVTLQGLRSGRRDRIYFYTYGFQSRFNDPGSTQVQIRVHADFLRMELGETLAVPPVMGAVTFEDVPYHTMPADPTNDPGLQIFGAITIAMEGRGCARNALHQEIVVPVAGVLEAGLIDFIESEPSPIDLLSGGFENQLEAFIEQAESDLLENVNRVRLGVACAASLLPGVGPPVPVGFHSFVFVPVNLSDLTETVLADQLDTLDQAPLVRDSSIGVIRFADTPLPLAIPEFRLEEPVEGVILDLTARLRAGP